MDNIEIYNTPHQVELSLNNKNAIKTLRYCSRILNRLGCTYWISGGTALGAYRDKKFIDGDTDIDVEVLGNEKTKEILWRLSGDYELYRKTVNKDRGFTYQLAFLDRQTEVLFDIHFFENKKSTVESYTESFGHFRYPISFIDKIRTIKFEGDIYPIIDPETYLNFIYGETWSTPTPKEKTIYNYHE